MLIDSPTPADYPRILAESARFWDGRDMSARHHPMFCRQFADTGLVARRDGIVGYLFGFVAPTGAGYVHLAAVRDDARGAGLGRLLYERFERLAAARGADRLTAITSPGNAGSIAFHRRLGCSAETVADYAGPGADRIVFHRPIRAMPGPGDAARDPASDDAGLRVERAALPDAGAVLTVQRAAFLAEAMAYGRAIPPVRETVAQIEAAIAGGQMLVARDGTRLVGAVRVARDGAEASISRLAVAPDRQGEGLGGRLLAAAEAHAGDVDRYVLFTGQRSERNLRLYRRHGYVETHRAMDPVGVPVVHLAKTRHTD